jgi:hypothetical protein
MARYRPRFPRLWLSLPLLAAVLAAALAAAPLGACGGNAIGSIADSGLDDPDARPESDAAPDAGADGDAGADASLPPECAPQEAWADGPCAAELPGIRWDGAHCVGLGSGCQCVGADCDAIYDTVAECVAARLGCYELRCDPAPVSDDACIDCTASVYLGAFWDGATCHALHGCGCHGDGCDRGFPTVEECEAVHAACPARLCEGSGGHWLPDTLCGPCGHHQCGLPSQLACCSPGCDCGPGQTYVDGVGCQPDAGCTPEQACLATHGVWHPQSECTCGFTCGVPNDCEACVDACDCGPYRTFDPQGGCQWDPACGSPTPESLCEDTGGAWHVDDGCGHYWCGEPNLLDPCIAPGCDCGIRRNFDSQLGCVYDEACLAPGPGEPCLGPGTSGSCRPGLVCCEQCGMAPGCPTCQVPCCQNDPGCQPNGCYPPPP